MVCTIWDQDSADAEVIFQYNNVLRSYREATWELWTLYKSNGEINHASSRQESWMTSTDIRATYVTYVKSASHEWKVTTREPSLRPTLMNDYLLWKDYYYFIPLAVYYSYDRLPEYILIIQNCSYHVRIKKWKVHTWRTSWRSQKDDFSREQQVNSSTRT